MMSTIIAMLAALFASRAIAPESVRELVIVPGVVNKACYVHFPATDWYVEMRYRRGKWTVTNEARF